MSKKDAVLSALALALLNMAQQTIAQDKVVSSLFDGMKLLQEFHCMPLSVVETFERAAALASKGCEREANNLMSTIRPDIVSAIDRIREQLNYAERIEKALAWIKPNTRHKWIAL